RRRHTRFSRDWSSDVCSSDLTILPQPAVALHQQLGLLQVQASLPALLLQQPGGLGKLLPGGQQLGQIEPVLARRLRRQSIMDQRSEERRGGKEGTARRLPEGE